MARIGIAVYSLAGGGAERIAELPVQRDLLACIVAPSAAQAEALSTALLVLGESEGLTLLERLEGVEGILLEANGSRWMTTGWQQTSHFISF